MVSAQGVDDEDIHIRRGWDRVAANRSPDRTQAEGERHSDKRRQGQQSNDKALHRILLRAPVVSQADAQYKRMRRKEAMTRFSITLPGLVESIPPSS
jgi:hypothetical protein